MLDLKDVDLGMICHALEDRSFEHRWWLDPKTGEIELRSDSYEEEEEEDEQALEEAGWLLIEPIDSREAYEDLADFVDRVRDPRARNLLERAITGRGAFRRFKDTLFDFPELRALWFRFHDVRMERRAIEWLADEGLIDPDAAERAIAERADPEAPELAGAFDPEEIARAVAQDLRVLYGERLRKVLLFGSWARGDAHPESDIDLLVVLDRMDSPWEELRRMDDILDRHSVANETVVSALAVAESDLDPPSSPALIRAQAEGRPVA